MATVSGFLVRASNTEPIIRIIAEAPSAEESRRLCDTAIHAMQAFKPLYQRRAIISRCRFLRGGMKCDQEWDGLAAEGVEYSPAGGEDVGNPADIAVFFEGCAAFAAADIHFYVVVGHAFELRNEPARTAFEARVFEFAEDAVVERDGAVEFDELADLVLEIAHSSSGRRRIARRPASAR